MRHGTHLMLALAVVSASTAVPAEAGRDPRLDDEQQRLQVESFDYVWTTIRDKHFDPAHGGVDWDRLRDELRPKVEQAGTRREARGILRDLIGRLGQSHFQIIPAEVLEAMAQPVREGSTGGDTGIDARVVGGHAIVTSVAPGSPAERAGVRPGWEVLRIDDFRVAKLHAVAREFEGKTASEMVLADAVLSRLAGRIGERVRVVFRDGSDRKVDRVLTFTEARGGRYHFGHVSNLHVWIETKRLEGNVGYIAFNAFLDPVRIMTAFDEAMRSMLEADGVVIDLRGNGGGMLPMAMGMAGWLVAADDLTLGTMTLRETSLRAVITPRARTFRGSVAVLVDGLSASCAEVFAGGLQDLRRAQVFGTRTAGMVLGSSIEKLPNGDGFQYAFAGHVSRSGKALEGVGVMPDTVAPPNRAALLSGRDPALDAAVAWILESRTRAGEEVGP
jgi:carboxyl-terminal processing protease